MPREKDPFRDYVEFLQNNKWKWKCNFCNIEYRGSVTRIKAHLAGFGGYGINACKKVDRRVRSKARKALKDKGEAESSNGSEGNVEECAHQPVTTNNEDAPRETSVPAMTHLSFNGASSSAFLPLPGTNLPNLSLPAQVPIPQMEHSLWTLPPQHHTGDSYIQPRNLSDRSSGGDLAPEAWTNMPGPVDAGEGEPNPTFPQDARTDYALMDSRPSTCGLVGKNMPTRKRKLEEPSNGEGDMDESETCCRKSSPLVTTELVGKESKEAIKKICDYLMDAESVIIGIYGMGGVGKTAILMHVHNRVLLEDSAFSNVFWVSVPQKFSVYELQDKIANAVGLDSLSKDKDVKRRASIMHRHLETMKSSILLLDGLWMHFEVKDVGIPIKKGGLKLVLTTRSLDVCHKMLCQMKIKIEPLCWEEDSWSLFLEKLCSAKELPSEVEEIARSILEMCGGLPLGIIEIATRLRGVEKVHEWKDLLQNLQESRMELDVLKELKLSYVDLGSPQVQRCFLHLVLCFGKDDDGTDEEELIESLIDEGLLGGIATRQKQHDQGNTILDKIRNSCLLEEAPFRPVQPLIRDMALQIATSTTHMVKAHMSLEEFPEEELWTDHLQKVFLQGNDIKEIPCSLSPNCPKLTRLSLNENNNLIAIHGSFFEHLKELKVLDLSRTGIMELPDSISHLERLEALLLHGCEELHHIPYVWKLEFLRKLDLKGCRRLEVVPDGMEMLVKLTYLDLRGTRIKTLPEGVLPNLVNLQFLAIEKVRAGEERELKKVEALYCSVPNVETFNACVRFLEQNSSRQYDLTLNLSEESFPEAVYERRIFIESGHSIKAWEYGGIGGDGGALLLPNNVQEEVEVGGCGGVRRLCEVGPLENLEVLEIKEWENLDPRLQSLTITGCPKLKHLLKWECLTPARLRNLKKIKIRNCEELEEIIRGPFPSGVTCGLTYLEVSGCNKMKRVMLTQDTLLQLPSLRDISVEDCKGVEVIIGGTVADTTPYSFPHLINLTLRNLPELKSICDDGRAVSCGSLFSLVIGNCPKLKRSPEQLLLLDNDNGLLLRSTHPFFTSTLGQIS
ncbi:probable disease resistance protein At4g27220 [Rhodamnia argentea]|uniref:Probable disease resistance protein At4g27220 n=1 Tax=Rhodamnia argentea TaxID=178133 RepID=A0ABM3H3C9_9MYRT|nr:probable disease resistance protein At4g27220 [Rhodamnia argentea]